MLKVDFLAGSCSPDLALSARVKHQSSRLPHLASWTVLHCPGIGTEPAQRQNALEWPPLEREFEVKGKQLRAETFPGNLVLFFSAEFVRKNRCVEMVVVKGADAEAGGFRGEKWRRAQNVPGQKVNDL